MFRHFHRLRPGLYVTDCARHFHRRELPAETTNAFVPHRGQVHEFNGRPSAKRQLYLSIGFVPSNRTSRMPPGRRARPFLPFGRKHLENDKYSCPLGSFRRFGPRPGLVTQASWDDIGILAKRPRIRPQPRTAHGAKQRAGDPAGTHAWPVSTVFDLGRSGGSDIARNKDAMVAEAFAGRAGSHGGKARARMS